jgi:hypothetical protein
LFTVLMFGLFLMLPLTTTTLAEERLPEPLCDYRNLKEEAFHAAELNCIRKAGVNVERVGERLTVPISHRTSSDKLHFKDNRAACDGNSGVDVGYCVHYTFLGYLSDINSVVIAKGCYEFCQDVLLVSLTGGGATIVGETVPQFSPDRSMFVIVAASDAGDGIRTPDIQLFEVINQKPVPVFQYREPRNMYEVLTNGDSRMFQSYESWRFLQWSSNTEVELTVNARGSGCHDNTDFSIKIQKITAMAWKLNPGPPCR